VVFLKPPFPRNFRREVILSCACRPLQSLSSPCPPIANHLAALGAEHLPWGFLPHRDITGGVYFAEPLFRSAPCRGHPKPASFRPRRFSRPRRFTPPPTLRACFIPQPRPGFALQGFPRASSRSGSSPDLALWSFLLIRCPPVLSIGLHEPASASRALLHLRVRCAPRWFRPRPARSPPELVLPRVFLRRP
jgi:hypothetical protein